MIVDFLRELSRFFLLYLIRPIALLCGALISSVYNVLFAWWLEPWTFKGRQTRFESDIRKEHPWIFEKYSAQILPTERYRQVLDYVVATVPVGDLLLKFVRGHGDYHVTVSPSHAPRDAYDFGEAIDLACDSELAKASAKNYRMSDFQQLFETNIDRLEGFFSEREYGPPRRDKSINKLIRL